MGEFISRKAVEDAVQDHWCDSSRMMEAIRCIPAADVAPVVHGKWEPIVDSYGKIEGWLCACGRESKEMANYCPNCGAKMGGGNSHGF